MANETWNKIKKAVLGDPKSVKKKTVKTTKSPKEIATENKEPYIEVLTLDIDAQNPGYKDDLNNILPENSNLSYNMKNIIKNIVDNQSFLEVQNEYAKNNVISGTCVTFSWLHTNNRRPYFL
mgnify:CR=1 FL=1